MNQNLPNYDATFCGKLPLHQTNLIQPHGFLFVLEASTMEVLQVSDNIESIAGKAPAEIAGSPIGQIVDASTLEQLQKLTQNKDGVRQPVKIGLNTAGGVVACSGLMHEKNGLLLLEVLNPDFADAGGGSFLEVYQDIRSMMHHTGQSDNIAHFATAVAQAVRRFSGFDKVMVYSFDADWHGTVLAEEKEAEMDAYLGLRFPASDVPKPARDLYLKNPYRFIPASDYKPARLYPLINPVTHTLTDLSHCDLRSVAAVHLEYLKNMKVGASMSLRLVHNGKLWGLVSCHHRTPKYFSFETIGVFELLSEIISAQLSIVLNNAVAQKQQSLQEGLTHLVPQLHATNNLQQAVAENAEAVQQLLGASGLAYNLNGHISTVGQVPNANDLHRLFFWLQVQSPEGPVHQPSLPQVFDEAAAFAQIGSGMLALPVVPQKGQFVVAFRPEAIEEVSWGGNPHEALQVEADGKTYHPRNSFKVWRQRVQHTAKAWSKEELMIAEAFRNVLTGIALQQMHA